MAVSLKPYRYLRGAKETLDTEFSQAPRFGNVKAGTTAVFWKAGLFWYAVSISQVQRIFRRIEEVSGKLCCGRQVFQIEKLVLILTDGTELELYIGENVHQQAGTLFQTLQQLHPTLLFGKP